MTSEDLKSEMRLYTIELLAMNLVALSCVNSAPANPHAIASRIRERLLQGARSTAFGGLDPAISDMASAEFEASVDRAMKMISGQIAAILQSRRGA